MWDQLTVTSNRECTRAAELRAKIDMRLSRVQRCARKKFYLPVALKEPVLCGIVESRYTFLIF